MQYRIPGIICSNSGSLFCYCECRDSSSDWANIDIQVMKSVDKAINWNVILKIEGNGDTLNNPVMVEKDGVLHFLFCKNYKEVFYCNSTDDGDTFSKPINITEYISNIPIHTVLALGPGHGIVTAAGVIIIPMWFANNPRNNKAHGPSFLGSLYSLDNGITWKCGEVIDDIKLSNPSECAIGLLSDRRVLISIRNENACHRRCFAVSESGYSHWQMIGFDERFPDPVCQGSMINYSGCLFHINCQDDKVRKNLVMRITANDFECYQDVFISDLGGYSDICVFDNTAYVLYERTTNNWEITLHLAIIEIDAYLTR